MTHFSLWLQVEADDADEPGPHQNHDGNQPCRSFIIGEYETPEEAEATYRRMISLIQKQPAAYAAQELEGQDR